MALERDERAVLGRCPFAEGWLSGVCAPHRAGVLCDSDDAGRREVRGVDLGRSADVEVFTLAALPRDACSLATGAEGLRLAALPASRDLVVGGGVEQTREILAYEAATRTVELARPFEPPPRALQEWRIQTSRHPFHDPLVGSATERTGLFLWNSEDALRGGSILLKAHAFDAEVGLPGATSVGRRIESGLDAPPVELGGSGITDNPQSVATGDFDGDGDLDLVSANQSGPDLTIFFQDAPGSFDPAPLSVGGNLITRGPLDVATGDLDGDGDLDLVSANRFGHELTVFFQDAPGSFGASLSVFFQDAPGSFDPDPLRLNGPKIGASSSIAVGDVDGNGALDLVSADFTKNFVAIAFQPALGGFDLDPLVLPIPGTNADVVSVTAADLDGNGALDIATANSGSNTLTVFHQDLPGSFDREPLVVGGPGITLPPVSMAAGDLDGDGDLDLASANWVGDDLTIFFQDVPGSFDPSPLVLGGTGITDVPERVAAADVDGDGDLDLISANSGLRLPFEGVPDLTVFFQRGAGRFDAVPLRLGGPGITERPVSLAVVDLDGDGDGEVDLVSGNDDNANVTVFWGGR